METIKKKMQSLREQLDDAQLREEEAKSDIASVTERADQLEGEKEDLQRKLTILQDDLEKSEERGNEHRKQAEEKAASLDETERLLRKLTSSKDADSDEKDILIEEIRTKTDAAVELEKQVESINGRVKLLEADLEAAEDRNDEQIQKIASLESDLTESTHALKERIVSDERSKKAEDDLVDQVSELKAKNTEQDNELEELRRKVSQLEHEKEKLEDDLEAAEQKCEQTKTELENTLAELSEI